MNKNRLEAFSDGVLAIVITIMVLELKAPHASEFSDLAPLYPGFLSYLLSFVFIGIYWNNHHHLLQAVHKVSGRVLWANLALLFCLSLIPFSTSWMWENHFQSAPVALYGVFLLAAGVSFALLSRTLISANGKESVLAKAVGANMKGKASILAYASAIPLSYLSPQIGLAIYVGVAILWLVPDRRIEKHLR